MYEIHCIHNSYFCEMVLFFTNSIENNIALFQNEEMRHIQNALRKSSGDEINFTDGKGTFYKGKILSSSKKIMEVEISHREAIKAISPYLHIAVAPTKNMDRIEWFVEKATELGINEISFIQCKHSERKNIKIDRLNRIAIAAMKQSLKAHQPILNYLISFEKWVGTQNSSSKLIACLNDSTISFSQAFAQNSSTTICIGPEGGFREDEIELANVQGFRSVSLGEHRLRTETAALSSVAYFRLLVGLGN